MKPVAAALAAVLILLSPCAHAQGYSGVMSPQTGYHPPPAPPSANNQGAQSNGMGDPYGGTGTTTATGYANMMQGSENGGQSVDMAVMEKQPDSTMEHTGSAYEKMFAPKDKDELGDGTDGSSIYDTVNDNAVSEAERRRQAILRKIDADSKKAAHDMEIATQRRDEQIRADINKTVHDQWKKDHPGEDSGDDDDSQPDGGTTGDAGGTDTTQ